MTLRIFLACLRRGPLNTKHVPEKNILVLIKNPIMIANINVFHACSRTSPLSTLLVNVQFLLVPDNRTVISSPAYLYCPLYMNQN